MKRSWVEIDLTRIEQNYRAYCSLLHPGQKIIAVVKADAYGHGDREIAMLLQRLGVTDFAVSNVQEALRLRQAGITGEILILGYTPAEELDTVAEHDITQAVISEEYAALLQGRIRKPKVQIAVDTGMNRIGLDADDPVACAGKIAAYQKQFDVTGVFTHLCVADAPEEEAFTQEQIEKFERVLSRLDCSKIPCIQYMNSAAGMWYNRADSGFVRLGIVLYGLKPDYRNQLDIPVNPALAWKTVVAMVKTVQPGESVGYGRTYRAEQPVRVATLPTGYADGYNRLLSNRGTVIVNGHRAPVIGNVCMDQMTVDVTGIPGVEVGTEVSLLCDTYTADDMAHEIGTIGYEIICSISKRVERIYLEG